MDAKAVIYRWFEEVWNQGREATIDELFAPDAIAHGLGEAGNEVRGPAGFKLFYRNMRTTFPDLRVRIDDAIAEGPTVVVRVTLEGTHLGDGFGVKATGKRVRVEGIVIARIDQGRIVEGWNSWDQLGLLQQLGALPAPAVQDRFLAEAG
jgi:steroid delta-isomerase-like uncharacterized protein